jgi:hypothetical protein
MITILIGLGILFYLVGIGLWIYQNRVDPLGVYKE